MNDNFEDPKPSKFKFMNMIVSPIPKKVLTFSNNDNLLNKPINPTKTNATPHEETSNIQKFVLHKNSAFRYLIIAKGSSILTRKLMVLSIIEVRTARPPN